MDFAKIHGAATHFPVALLMASLACDGGASLFPGLRGLRSAAYWTLIGALLGTIPAIVSGVVMSRGDLLGHDILRLHHVFVWPASALLVALTIWRLTMRRGSLVYLGAALVTTSVMMGAAYWGGELMLAREIPAIASVIEPARAVDESQAQKGRALFVASCAHCHGIDARGDEGPDLHGLQVSDRYIGRVVERGIKGEMPSFAKKYDAAQIDALTAYLRSL
jgi:mono/diheme cytochrome c family protein